MIGIDVLFQIHLLQFILEAASLRQASLVWTPELYFQCPSCPSAIKSSQWTPMGVLSIRRFSCFWTVRCRPKQPSTRSTQTMGTTSRSPRVTWFTREARHIYVQRRFSQSLQEMLWKDSTFIPSLRAVTLLKSRGWRELAWELKLGIMPLSQSMGQSLWMTSLLRVMQESTVRQSHIFHLHQCACSNTFHSC